MYDRYGNPLPIRHRPWWMKILGQWRWIVYPAIGVLAVLASLAGARILGEQVRDALETESNLALGPVTVEIPAGSTANEIAEILYDSGIIDSVNGFEREVRSRGVTADLKAGTYDFESGVPVPVAVDRMVEGPGRGADVFPITVVEGLTVEEILASLERQTAFTADDYRAALLDGAVSTALRSGPFDELADWEGLLFPDTYELDATFTPSQILQLMSDTAQLRVNGIDWSRLDELDVTRYEALVVASMIEREAALEEDRPLISSVIYNRLARGQILGIDATVVYARGYREGEITLSDLAIDSPYNTRLYAGLPPTPIGAPGVASLQAAADPADTDFYYYVLVDPAGKHGFAETEEEFERLKAQARADGVIP